MEKFYKLYKNTYNAMYDPCNCCEDLVHDMDSDTHMAIAELGKARAAKTLVVETPRPSLKIVDDENFPLLLGFSCEPDLLKALNQDKNTVWLLNCLKDKEFVGAISINPHGNEIQVKLTITTADGTLSRLTDIYNKLSSFNEEKLILLDGIDELRKQCGKEPLAAKLWSRKDSVVREISVFCTMKLIKRDDGPNQLVILCRNNNLFVVSKGTAAKSVAKWKFASEPTYVSYVDRPDDLLKLGLVEINTAAVNFRLEELENIMAHSFRLGYRLGDAFDILKEHKKEVKERYPDDWNEWNSLRLLLYKRDSSRVKDLVRYVKVPNEITGVVTP